MNPIGWMVDAINNITGWPDERPTLLALLVAFLLMLVYIAYSCGRTGKKHREYMKERELCRMCGEVPAVTNYGVSGVSIRIYCGKCYDIFVWRIIRETPQEHREQMIATIKEYYDLGPEPRLEEDGMNE